MSYQIVHCKLVFFSGDIVNFHNNSGNITATTVRGSNLMVAKKRITVDVYLANVHLQLMFIHNAKMKVFSI